MRFLFSLFLAQNALSVSAFVSPSQSGVARLNYPPSSTSLYDAKEPLAEEGTWQAFLDEDTTGLVYYFDSRTGESLWEPPTPTFPDVKLNRKTQRQADDLRRKYRKARQQEAEGTAEIEVEQPKAEKPNWIDDFIQKEDAAPSPAPAKTEQKGDWFTGMFGDSKSGESQSTGEEEEPALPNGETRVQKVDIKRGILESFAAISMPKSSEATEAAVVETRKVEEQVLDISPQPIKIEIGSFVLPHPAKVRWGGEDAVFTKGRSFGVFDGVSGAEKLDGVPLYSRTLADEMKRMVNRDGISVQDMTKFLTEAAEYADSSATGASTAVVASIGENGFLQALNVGDSSCMIIRDGKIAAKTREISHYWECPYQLSEDSPDRPRDGTKLNVELIPGDLILMGSDGIFDNVSDDMLLDVVSKSPPKASQLAKKICDVSRKQSLDRTSVTPYGKQSQKRGDPDYKDGLGGKVDDASCIVVLCK
jgi:protein phosphatase PTC7